MTEEKSLAILIQGFFDLFFQKCQCRRISNGQQVALTIGRVDSNSEKGYLADNKKK
jgi:hypothetical protein